MLYYAKLGVTKINMQRQMKEVQLETFVFLNTFCFTFFASRKRQWCG